LRRLADGTVQGASFAPSGPDRLVYGLSHSRSLLGPVDLYEIGVDGSGARRLTHDGRSFGPAWGALGIAFDRERLRGRFKSPAYQLWLRSGSHHTRRLTDLRVPALLDGLEAVGFSTDGERLLAEFVGEDTSYAWTLSLRGDRLRALRVGGQRVQGFAISADGRRVLVVAGDFEGRPTASAWRRQASTAGARRGFAAAPDPPGRSAPRRPALTAAPTLSAR
jgi:hypothetical protein